MIMGRKRKYNTEEEILEARRKRQRKYYLKNRENIIAKKMKEYWEKKNEKNKMET